jgi:hypothetical protein
MGRPLNKKYFGNRNIGTGGNQITGNLSNSQNYADDRIGGQGVASAAVTVAGSYTTRPTFTFSAPTIPGGVTATGVVISEVLSATISGGTGYGNAQTFNLTVNTAGGTAVLNVTSNAGGAVVTVNSITTRGTFTTLGPVTSVSGGTGTGAVPVLTFRGKSVTITEAGSGYTAAPTIAGYTNQGGITIATIVLTTDSGAPGTATNQENAIIMYANVGNGAAVVDIIRQVSTRRYKVTDGTTVGIVEIGTDATPETGEAYIVATATGGTYFVTKLTAHKATLVTKTGDGVLNGLAAPWSFNAPTATVVQLENA